MHIAFVTPEYPHEKVQNAAGIGTSIKNLVLALVKQGITVSIFVYSQKKSAIIKENGVTIHLIKYKKYRLFSWFFHRKYIQNYLNDAIVADKIDLIEAPDWTGITAFMNLKIPVVIRLHGSDAYFCHLENRKQKLKNYWFEKLALQQATALIAPTRFAGEVTKKIFQIKNKPIKTIFHGVQPQHFLNENVQFFEEGLILYIGTIIRKKGVLELPKILEKVIAEHPSARMVLIGSDSYDLETQSESTWKLLESSLDDTIRQKIEYLGKVPYQEVQNYLKKANVCVFPTFAETFGMVTIEAMAMQKAVVNSNIGWANELILDGESGFLVHPKDHIRFASKISTILNNDDLSFLMGKKARIRVEECFDIDKQVIENIDFYKSLI